MFFGLVVLVGVDGVFGEDFAGFAVDDHGVGAVGEGHDWAVFVGPADAEVAEFAGVAQGDDAGGVDVVEADAVVGSGDVDGGCGWWSGGVGGGGGASSDSAVGPFVVVDVCEGVELVLELLDGLRGGLGSEPAFEGLVEAFDFALGLGVAW